MDATRVTTSFEEPAKDFKEMPSCHWVIPCLREVKKEAGASKPGDDNGIVPELGSWIVWQRSRQRRGPQVQMQTPD